MAALISLWLTWLAAWTPAAPAARPADAELVVVDGIGPVRLAGFDCTSVARSTVVGRVCHDASRDIAVAEIRGRMRAWCGVDRPLVDAWLAAPSMGRFLSERIEPLAACADPVPVEQPAERNRALTGPCRGC